MKTKNIILSIGIIACILFASVSFWLDSNSEINGMKIISLIAADSPAARAGMQQGEIIQEINLISVKGTDKFKEVFSTLNPGNTVPVKTSLGNYKIMLGENTQGNALLGVNVLESKIWSAAAAARFGVLLDMADYLRQALYLVFVSAFALFAMLCLPANISLRSMAAIIIAMNIADIILTRFALSSGAKELNPLASLAFVQIGFWLTVAIKLVLVVFACWLLSVAYKKTEKTTDKMLNWTFQQHGAAKLVIMFFTAVVLSNLVQMII